MMYVPRPLRRALLRSAGDEVPGDRQPARRAGCGEPKRENVTQGKHLGQWARSHGLATSRAECVEQLATARLLDGSFQLRFDPVVLVVSGKNLNDFEGGSSGNGVQQAYEEFGRFV